MSEIHSLKCDVLCDSCIKQEAQLSQKNHSLIHDSCSLKAEILLNFICKLMCSGGARPGPPGARALAGKGCAPSDEVSQN